MTAAAAGGGALPARRRRGVTPRAAVLALVVVALLLSMVVPARAYLAQRARLEELERQGRVFERQNAVLLDEVRRLHDPRHIEELARCRGMVRPGEIPFVVLPKGEARGDAPAC